MVSSLPLAFATCGPVITYSPLPSYSPEFALSVTSGCASTESSMPSSFSGRTLTGTQVNKRVNTFTVRPNKLRFEAQFLQNSADGAVYSNRGEQSSQAQDSLPFVMNLTKSAESHPTSTTGKTTVYRPDVFTRVQQGYKYEASSQQHCVKILPLSTTSSLRQIKAASDFAFPSSEPVSEIENSDAPLNAGLQGKSAALSTLATEQEANPNEATFNGAASLPLLNILSLGFRADRMTVCKPTSVSFIPTDCRRPSNGGSYDGRKRLLPVTIVPTLVNGPLVGNGNLPRDGRSTASSPAVPSRRTNEHSEDSFTHEHANGFMLMSANCDASPLSYEQRKTQHAAQTERTQIQQSSPATNKADCYADLANNPQEYVASQCLSEPPTFSADVLHLEKETRSTIEENYNVAFHDGVTASQGSPPVLPSYSISTYHPSAALLQSEQAETDNANLKMSELLGSSYLRQNEHVACHERTGTATNDIQYGGASVQLRRSVRRRYSTCSKTTGTCHLSGFTQGETNLGGGKFATTISGVLDPSHFQSKKDVIAYIESKLENMAECFTFKSATYQTYLKQFLPRPDDKQRKYIEKVNMFPRIPTSAVEERELQQLRTLQEGMPSGVSTGGRLLGCEGLSIKERLDEILTSLVNKIMFLLVVEHETWYIHAPAREQIREELLEFIWPDAPDLHAFYRDHFSLFIDMRIRHFRDSVARYFRDRPKGTSCKTSGQSLAYNADDECSQSTHAASLGTCCGPPGVPDTLMRSALSPKSNFPTSKGANVPISSTVHLRPALHGSSKDFQNTNSNNEASCLLPDISVDVWMHKPYSLDSVTNLTAEVPQCDNPQYTDYSAWCSERKDSTVHLDTVRVNPGCSLPPFIASQTNHIVTQADRLCQHLESSASANNAIPPTLSSTPLLAEPQESEIGLIYYGEENNPRHEAPLYSPRSQREPDSSHDQKQRTPSNFSPYPSEASLLFSQHSSLWQSHTTAPSPYPLRVMEHSCHATEVSSAAATSSDIQKISISPSENSSERFCARFHTSGCKPSGFDQRSTTSHLYRSNRDPEVSHSISKTPPGSFLSSVESETKGYSISNDAHSSDVKNTLNSDYEHPQTYSASPIISTLRSSGGDTSPLFNGDIVSVQDIEMKKKSSAPFQHSFPGPNKPPNAAELSLLNDTPSPYAQALNPTSHTPCPIKPEAHDEHAQALFGLSSNTREERWEAHHCSSSPCCANSSSDSPKAHVHSTQPPLSEELLKSSRIAPLLPGDSELPTIYDDIHYVNHTPENFKHYSSDEPKETLFPLERSSPSVAPLNRLHRLKQSASSFKPRTSVTCQIGFSEKPEMPLCVKRDNEQYITKEANAQKRKEESQKDSTPLPSLVVHRNSSFTKLATPHKRPLESSGQKPVAYPHNLLPQAFKTFSPSTETKMKADMILSSQMCSCPQSTSFFLKAGVSPKRMKIADFSTGSRPSIQHQTLSTISPQQAPQSGSRNEHCLEAASSFKTSKKEGRVSEIQLARKHCESDRKRHHSGSDAQVTRAGVSKVGTLCSSFSPEQQDFATESTLSSLNRSPQADSTNGSPLTQMFCGKTKLLRISSARDLPSFRTLPRATSLPASDESLTHRGSPSGSTDPEATLSYCFKLSGQPRVGCCSPYSESHVLGITAPGWCTSGEKSQEISCSLKTVNSDSADCGEDILDQSDVNNSFQPSDDCYALPLTEAACSFSDTSSLGHKVLRFGTTQGSDCASTEKNKTIVQCQFIIPHDSNTSHSDHYQADNSCALLSPVSKAFDSGSVGRLSPVSEDSTPRFRFPQSGFHEQQFIFSQSPKMGALERKQDSLQHADPSNYISFNHVSLDCGGETSGHDGISSYLSPTSLFASPSSQTSSGSFSSLVPLSSLGHSVSQLDLGQTESGFTNNYSIPENLPSSARQRQNLTPSLSTMTTPFLSVNNTCTQGLFSYSAHKERPTNLFLTAASACPVATSTFLPFNDRPYHFENRAEMQRFMASDDCNSSPATTHYVSHALAHNVNALHVQDCCSPRFPGMPGSLIKTTSPVCVGTGRLYTIDQQPFPGISRASPPLQSNVTSPFESI